MTGFNRYRLLTILGLALLFFVGCDSEGPTLSTAQQDVIATVDFGDPYEIAAGQQPRLDANSLLVLVQYSGGCADHGFNLHTRLTGNDAEVWLQHDSNGDNCEAYLRDTLTLALSDQAVAASSVTLLSPDGKTFRLK